MTQAAVLGHLSTLHSMMSQLVTCVPPEDAARQFHRELGSLSWYFGRAVYLETYWLRQVLCGDDDLSARVEHLFTPGVMPLADQCRALPPPDHLVHWAGELQSEHLLRLANPGKLPVHRLMDRERLPWFLLQEQGRLYERMLMVLNQRRLRTDMDGYVVEKTLPAAPPGSDAAQVDQGHYRVGARDDDAAYDNELPPQAVELSTFRIAASPVSNSEFLAFMTQGGYADRDWWNDAGWEWLRGKGVTHPEYWRRDRNGNWYGVGINGPADLPSSDPVTGISRHEAEAYAAWSATREDGCAGAIIPHEYQWEVAARLGVLGGTGRVQEWCSNPFHPYPEYSSFPDPAVSERFFGTGRFSLRGASLHTQRPLRRLTRRDHLEPHQRFAFTGTRLVIPPAD